VVFATEAESITTKAVRVVKAKENFRKNASGFSVHVVVEREFLVWKFVQSAKALEKSGLIEFCL